MLRATLLSVSLLAAACGAPSSKCVTGQTVSCACVDGRTGAQACQPDGTFGACQCGASTCNASSCTGCCDATGACQAGTATSACGRSGQGCLVCGAGQACLSGACGTAGTGGGGGSLCSPANCVGCCDANGSCRTPSGSLCGQQGNLCNTCITGQLCVSGSCVTGRRVFITRTAYAGNLGGLAGADQKCATAAQAAGLGGTWKAWLSDGTTDALARMADVGPWFNVSQQRVFNNKANLQTTPLTSIYYNEIGGTEGGANVWTGTLVGGTRATAHCQGWTVTAASSTGLVGLGSSSTNSWTGSHASGCDNLNQLYCFEQ